MFHIPYKVENREPAEILKSAMRHGTVHVRTTVKLLRRNTSDFIISDQPVAS